MCCELVFFLYNANTKSNISEDYIIQVGASGLQEDLAKIGATKVIFKVITSFFVCFCYFILIFC